MVFTQDPSAVPQTEAEPHTPPGLAAHRAAGMLTGSGGPIVAPTAKGNGHP